MADVFGDLSLFSEFEKEREAQGSFIHYDEDAERSRIIFEGFESDEEDDDIPEVYPTESKCAAGKLSSDTETKIEAEDAEAESETTENDDEQKEESDKSGSMNGNACIDKAKAALSIENEKAIAWLNDQLHEEAAEEAKRSNVSVNQVIYEKNKYRKFSNILDSTRYVPDEDSPAVQLLFSNNSFSRKYRQQIEQFIKGLLWNEFTSGSKPSEAFQEVEVRPGAPSCIDINAKLTAEQRTETMRQKHCFIGSSQFHNKFLIDFLGWPFSVIEPTRCNVNWEIPLYTQVFNEVFADPTNKGKAQPKKKLKPSCWNCGSENHGVAECRLPRNPVRISANRKEYMELQSQQHSDRNKFTGASRYHLDPDISSKFAKFQPGQISEALTKALGLRDDQLPQHIYSMRLYGYPPGWLAEAKQIQSSVNMFDKNGRVTLITGECLEDGELNDEGGEKDPTSDYDINKIIEYPGFTVNVPEGCVDEHETFSMPPIQDHQLKKTLMKQSNEKALAKKRKRETDKEERKKAKKAKIEGEDGEIEDKEEGEEEDNLDGTGDAREEETDDAPKIIKISSTISISKDYGTPILVREKSALPDATKFGVGVEDHIPFENLPNSTGTFEKMKDLIDLMRKKRSESL